MKKTFFILKEFLNELQFQISNNTQNLKKSENVNVYFGKYNNMSLIWLNCLRQLKDDVEKDKKNMQKLKEIKDVSCFLYTYIFEKVFFEFSMCQDSTTVTIPYSFLYFFLNFYSD